MLTSICLIYKTNYIKRIFIRFSSKQFFWATILWNFLQLLMRFGNVFIIFMVMSSAILNHCSLRLDLMKKWSRLEIRLEMKEKDDPGTHIVPCKVVFDHMDVHFFVHCLSFWNELVINIYRDLKHSNIFFPLLLSKWNFCAH